MNLQEFLCFRRTCFVCGAPIDLIMTDWTDNKNPISMSVGTLKKMKLMKCSHSGLSIFFSPSRNNFNIFPNEDRTIDIEMVGQCAQDRTHYSFESQMMRLEYKEKTWAPIPSISLQEIVYIGQGHIFSAVNSYDVKKTWVIRSGLSEHVVIPLVDTVRSSFEEFNDKLKIYLTFS